MRNLVCVRRAGWAAVASVISGAALSSASAAPMACDFYQSQLIRAFCAQTYSIDLGLSQDNLYTKNGISWPGFAAAVASVRCSIDSAPA